MSDNSLTKAAARYFAMLVKADKKVLGVEGRIVSEILSGSELKTRNIMLSAYHQVLETDDDPHQKKSILKTIAGFNQDEKLYILGCLWRLAICDDELHHEEEKLIYDFVDAVDIDRRTAIAVQAEIINQT